MAEKVAPTTTEAQPERITAEQYMAEYAHDHYEWVRGELIKMTPVSLKHERISIYLRILLETYFNYRPIGTAVIAPFVMQVEEVESRREPDIQVILNENPGELKDTVMIGPADICIEIVSPESVARDHGDKFAEYEKSGVREYWIVDPIREHCRFNQLNDQGIYVTNQIGPQGAYESELLPDLVLDVGVFWEEKLPEVAAIVEQVKAMVGAGSK